MTTESEVAKRAREEIAKEDFETSVTEMKRILRARKGFWKRVFPFKIVRR